MLLQQLLLLQMRALAHAMSCLSVLLRLLWPLQVLLFVVIVLLLLKLLLPVVLGQPHHRHHHHHHHQICLAPHSRKPPTLQAIPPCLLSSAAVHEMWQLSLTTSRQQANAFQMP